MTFEFDQAKSLANKAKHGIDFIEAQALWVDIDRLRRDRPTNHAFKSLDASRRPAGLPR